MDNMSRHADDVHRALDRYVSKDGWANEWAEITARSQRRGRRRTWIIGASTGAIACGTLAILTMAFLTNSTPPSDITAGSSDPVVIDPNTTGRPFSHPEVDDVNAATASREPAPGWPEPVVLAGIPLKVAPGQRDGIVCLVVGLPEGNATECGPDVVLQRDGATAGGKYVGGSNVIGGVAPRGTRAQPSQGLLVEGRFFLMPSDADSLDSVTFVDENGKAVKTLKF